MTEVEVVIWGAGISGSQLASSLAKAGISTVVIPRGPASYPVLPGVGAVGTSNRHRATRESELLAEASANGATVLRDESIASLLPTAGAIRTVLTDRQSITTRCVVFADGSDPRIGRDKGFLPEWDPWQLVHFAWQKVTNTAHADIVIAGSRDGHAWRGYVANVEGEVWLGVGWFLEHEMNSHIHVTELLVDLQMALSLGGTFVGDPRVEVVPYEPRRLAASFCADNVMAVGDLTGIVNPLSLRRTEISLKIGVSASRMIEQWLQGESAVRFEPHKVGALFRPYVEASWQNDNGPPMSPVPRPPERKNRFAALLQRVADRTQR